MYILQATHTASLLIWTSNVENSINTDKPEALVNLYFHILQSIKELISLIRDGLDEIEQRKVIALVT